MNFETYEIKRKKGIDDLLSEFAFKGNSQGDESVSNNIEDFIKSEGWMSYTFKDVPMEQEAINKEVLRRKKHNEDYIAKLKSEGRFGEEYAITFHLKSNPIFYK